MKTYCDNGFRYYYDTHLRMWTLQRIDKDGNQIGETEYYPDKKTLIKSNPELKFTKAN